MEKDNFYMNLALEEAKKGRYQTWKNPMVGAVIVKNGQVLATGYHHHYGQNHAERDAISKLTPEQLFNSTLYVTLEPCNHYGSGARGRARRRSGASAPSLFLAAREGTRG